MTVLLEYIDRINFYQHILVDYTLLFISTSPTRTVPIPDECFNMHPHRLEDIRYLNSSKSSGKAINAIPSL